MPATAEFTTVEQWKILVEQFHAETVAEKEDAAKAKARAAEHTKFVNNLITQMTTKKFPADQIAAIQNLIDPCKVSESAANDRIAAEDSKTTGAANAVTMAAQHADLRGRAAGEMYNS